MLKILNALLPIEDKRGKGALLNFPLETFLNYSVFLPALHQLFTKPIQPNAIEN